MAARASSALLALLAGTACLAGVGMHGNETAGCRAVEQIPIVWAGR